MARTPSVCILAAMRPLATNPINPLTNRLAAVLACGLLVLGALAPTLAFAGAATPSGGCPPPPNTLAITEYAVGEGDQPRWLELVNPGGYAISLQNVQLVIKGPPGAPGKPPSEVQSYELGNLVDEVPAGEYVAFGFVPAGPSLALLKLKVIDLGVEFSLPCAAKASLEGPAGVIDMLSWDVCKAKSTPTWGLDPAQISPCKNDEPSNWCAAQLDPNGSPKLLGTPGKSNTPCDVDGDGIPSVAGAGGEADCDDKNKAVFPGAVEVCNGQDDDCNGLTDDSPSVPLGTCPATGVCSGAQPVCYGAAGFACAMPAGYEPVTETLCDSQDNDCDGLTDEGLTNACGTCGTAPPEECNGKDDDCNGMTDDVVSLPNQCTTTGVCALSKPACVGGVLGCEMPLSFQVTETLCDGLDNDCDGHTDEEMGVKDSDRGISASSCTYGTGVCTRPGERFCALDGTVVCKAELVSGTAEICGDALDNDCDGETDEDFKAVGSACTSGLGICKVNGKAVCSADKHAVACSAQPLKSLGYEVCGNQLDDNCDGQIDEQPCQDAAQSSCSAKSGAGPAGGWSMLAVLLAVLLAVVGMRRRGSAHPNRLARGAP